MTPRLKRWLRRAAAGTGVLIAGGGVTAYLGLNHVVRQAVERQSTRSINLATTVDSASLAVLGRNLHLENFRIASPAGFSGEPLLVVPSADMGMTYSRLRDDPVHIASVTFDRPRLLVEVVGGKINLKRMTEQLPPRPPHPLRLVIGEVRVRDAVVVLRPGVPGWPAELTVPVATFTLRDLGGGEATPGGVTVREVVTELIRAVAAHAADSDALPPELRAVLKGDVGALVAELGAGLQRRLADAVPADARRVFGGLFGGRQAATRPATRPAAPAANPAFPLAARGPARRMTAGGWSGRGQVVPANEENGSASMFDRYEVNGLFDEMFDGQCRPRPHYAPVASRLSQLGQEAFARRVRMADVTFRNQGITFTVYKDAAGVEKIFPFDLIPRIVPAGEWNTSSGG